ncbi:MAG: DUF5821 family protein, partial [Halobaculum sp.]
AGSSTSSSDTSVRLLVTPSDARELFGAFRPAALAADLIDAGQLEVATTGGLRQRLTVTETTTHAHVTVDGNVVTGETTADQLREAVYEEYTSQWERATAYEPDVPGLVPFLDTFAEQFPEAAATLRVVLQAADTVSLDGPFDPVTVVVLVGARHELQTLRISEWAEEIDFSSRTELSRVVSRLCDRGLVETDGVPHGVGRPRQKLLLADDRLRSAPAEELVATARDSYEH